MLKKVIFVMLALLIATSAFAQLQSGPSNKVGYVKIEVPAGTTSVPASVPFGLPFKFWTVSGNVPQYGLPDLARGSMTPSMIFGDQLPHYSAASTADKIQKQGGAGEIGWIHTSGNWSGTLQSNNSCEPGRAYWYVNKHAATQLVIAGEVDNTGNYDTLSITVPTAPSTTPVSTPLSWRDARALDRSTLNLLGAVYGSQFIGSNVVSTADKLQSQKTGGGLCWYKTSAPAGWQPAAPGLLTTLVPGDAYWVVSRQNSSVRPSWNYSYNATGGSLLQVDQKPTEPAVQKMETPIMRTPTAKGKAH